MNERIHELVMQARAYAEEKQNNPYRIYTQDCFNEKFAELIVRECASVVDSVPLGYGDYRDQIERAMRDACVSAVLQHFGVEK